MPKPDDDGARRTHEACLHREACLRAAKRKSPLYGTPWESLGCLDCEEWEDRFCPLSLAGTMRCNEECVRR